jgi:hypothetical protein
MAAVSDHAGDTGRDETPDLLYNVISAGYEGRAQAAIFKRIRQPRRRPGSPKGSRPATYGGEPVKNPGRLPERSITSVGFTAAAATPIRISPTPGSGSGSVATLTTFALPNVESMTARISYGASWSRRRYTGSSSVADPRWAPMSATRRTISSSRSQSSTVTWRAIFHSPSRRSSCER